MRGAPYVPRLSVWMRLIMSARTSSSMARSVFGLVRRAYRPLRETSRTRAIAAM